MEPLDQYRWKNRLVVLFTPTLDDTHYQEQRTLLAAADDELTERDTLVIDIVGETAESAEARQRYDAQGQGFTVVLVGKDGTAKLVERTPVAAERLMSLIDSMPMRQQEQ